jgi:hypothetical protein
VDSHVSKDDLKFLKELRGVNEWPNGYKVIFKHYKCVGLIGNNIMIKINNVIRWKWQYGFHDG